MSRTLVNHLRSHNRYRRVSSHPTCIWADVIFTDPFVVLRGQKKDHMPPIGHPQDGELLPLHELLYDDLGPRLSKGVAGEHRLRRFERLLCGRANDRALPGRETGGLHRQGPADVPRCRIRPPASGVKVR